ncbi:ERI1 exoribonuclease 3 [Fopius arisanus]|uniref:ERI1 exoribonuclease 3 n=1 Tax=Fopius arisanus TaxID=64838 RepID=A0A9R1U1P5_9HYME|nr:PREDICTED: ERI1 exoribonuclease 3 [Fopius arisanus]
MSMRLLARRAQRLLKNRQDVVQPFKYLLVLDFEATCEKDIPIETPEIIEFPCVALNTQSWEIEEIFHRYIKPRVKPILTPFCTELTGIMQETVDDEEHFPQVFKDFSSWMQRNNFDKDKCAFVTCGDWDLKVMLPGQCAIDGLKVPEYLNKWINLKRSYCEATQIYPKSLNDMIRRLKLQPQGRAHSGLHDSINMVQVIETLAKNHKAKFDLTSVR